MCDPRSLGFNYGKGWGSAPKPPIYLHAMQLARRLGQETIEKSAQVWALEMAIRNVRLATTGVEKAVAVVELANELKKLELATA